MPHWPYLPNGDGSSLLAPPDTFLGHISVYLQMPRGEHFWYGGPEVPDQQISLSMGFGICSGYRNGCPTNTSFQLYIFTENIKILKELVRGEGM